VKLERREEQERKEEEEEGLKSLSEDQVL